MHQIVSATVDSSRRWWVLAIVVAAQFMFGVDAFIVNVAIPTIAVELHASPAQIEAVIAIYLIAYAALVITGGRLGDMPPVLRRSARYSLRSKPQVRPGWRCSSHRRCLRCRL